MLRFKTEQSLDAAFPVASRPVLGTGEVPDPQKFKLQIGDIQVFQAEYTDPILLGTES